MIRKFKDPIYVTKPFLPPIEEFKEGLTEIWANHWLTNDGPVIRRFEKEIKQYLNVQNVTLFNNGTLALQLGLQALSVTDEVITTPFSFVATTHALTWNKIHPVFVDIEPVYYTLDPDKVEESITPATTAILAVHVFGYPCKLEELSEIAKRHSLLLIYDAAHAFGVTINGKSIAESGDLSMFSFHATKLFHSAEGGMLSYPNEALRTELEYLRNFGIKNETEVVRVGSNAKMNELQALMGLNVLKYFPEIVNKRKTITDVYRNLLEDVPGIGIPPPLPNNIGCNFSYFPIEIDEAEFGSSRDRLYEKLKEFNIFSRRYFYPLINELSCYKHIKGIDPLLVASKVADRILNLPIYFDLEINEVEQICDVISYLAEKRKKII